MGCKEKKRPWASDMPAGVHFEVCSEIDDVQLEDMVVVGAYTVEI
jgi:hypothetical protein